MTLPATLRLTDAASQHWDAVVIGAGPAGALTARQLALGGARVLLLDRCQFPRLKVCGCCLSESALHTLREVGLETLAIREGAVPLQRLRWNVAGREVELPLPPGLALSRQRFDSALVAEAIQAGSHFLPGVAGHRTSQGLFLSGLSQTLHPGLLIAAVGLGGWGVGLKSEVLAGSLIGAGTLVDQAPDFYGPGTIYMSCGPGGYAGLVRLEDGRLDVAAALAPAFVRQMNHPGQAVAQLLQAAGWPVIGDLQRLPWKGTPALTRRARVVAGRRFFVVGDAAGYVEPFTGEGLAWALASAAALAPLALDALHQGWTPAHGRRWSERRARLLGQRQRLCRLLTLGLRWPRLSQTVVSLLRWLPFLARPFVPRSGR